MLKLLWLIAALVISAFLPTGVLSAQTTDSCNGYPRDDWGVCTKTVMLSPRLVVGNQKGDLDPAQWAQGLGGGWKTADTYYNLAPHPVEAQVDYVGSDGGLVSVFVYRSDDKSFKPISITDNVMATGASISLRALAVAQGGKMVEDNLSGYVLLTYKSSNPADLDAETPAAYSQEVWFRHWDDSTGKRLFHSTWLADPLTMLLLPGTYTYRFGLLPGDVTDPEGEVVGLSLANPSEFPAAVVLTITCANGTVMSKTAVVQPWTSMDSMLDAFFPGVFQSGTLAVVDLKIASPTVAVAPFLVKIKGDGGTALLDEFEPAPASSTNSIVTANARKSLVRPAWLRR